ncbi:MAG: glutamate 5-kinase [Deltaproteobacteria bacterium]|jgi:glutamate 5-kinase|nr:glutamate 5-kinase [Deltaproteobacteria bacterium]
MDRRPYLKNIKRAVVKIGSGVLTRKNGLNLNLIDDITTEISKLRKKGVEIILVSSGAIAAGLKKRGLSRRPDSTSQMQALAAMGQSSLIRAYEEAFARHNARCAQVLLTRDDLTHRRRYLNARNTFLTLLSWGIIPIVNENDTVVVDEIKFGDNDNLGAMVTNLTEAQLLINLTNIDGLYDRDPRQDKGARLIPVVDKVDRSLSRAAGSIPGFLGTGGMTTKLAAAKKVSLGGVPSVIANGLKPDVLKDVFAGKPVGTFFKPSPVHLNSKKQWIAFTKKPTGEIVIDAGAEKALLKNGKSLLPSGIVNVRGRFSVGNVVAIKNLDQKKIAVGLVNYSSTNLQQIKGAKTAEIESILGYKHDDEIIHRDNLVPADMLADPHETDSDRN